MSGSQSDAYKHIEVVDFVGGMIGAEKAADRLRVNIVNTEDDPVVEVKDNNDRTLGSVAVSELPEPVTTELAAALSSEGGDAVRIVAPSPLDVSAAVVGVQEDTPLDVSAAVVGVQEDTPLDVSATTVPTEQQTPIGVEDTSDTQIDPATEESTHVGASTATIHDGSSATDVSESLSTPGRPDSIRVLVTNADGGFDVTVSFDNTSVTSSGDGSTNVDIDRSVVSNTTVDVTISDTSGASNAVDYDILVV